MGTVCSVTLYEQGTARVYRDIFSRLRKIENRTSVNPPDSEVFRINAAAAREAVRVHGEVFTVIERALRYAAFSTGAFDPAAGTLVSLGYWGRRAAPSPARGN
jgi:thiamine biosynthesis lipoprotein